MIRASWQIARKKAGKDFTGLIMSDEDIEIFLGLTASLVLKPNHKVEVVNRVWDDVPGYIVASLQSIPQVEEPGLIEKAQGFTKAMVSWASNGFPMVSDEVLSERKKICKNCEYWDSTSYGDIGKCKKCGCSGAKLHLSTSRCPIGLWSATKE
jgi:hypothetical protein